MGSMATTHKPASKATRAREDFEKVEHRWVAEVLNHVVYADPTNTEAKNLLADTHEQLAHQSDAGTWRGLHLSAAKDYHADKHVDDADASVRLNEAAFREPAGGALTVDAAVDGREVTVAGDASKLSEFFSLFDTFDARYNVVTPIESE
jgi:alkyl sulfatase BDS1-like metallo-beta-lactamase superfamily hydrolase